jgi:branched-chain amino acid transport system substrate-binding protein
MKRKWVLVAGLVAATAVAAGALASAADTPGVTDGTILLGGTAPLSGEASAAAGVAKGAEAYFNYVNAHGGVLGRTIQYRYVDDAYDPTQTVQAVRGLVQHDNVFAIFNTLGTNSNLAIRDFLNQLKVPQLFAASGASTFGADYKRYPYTIGYIPSYVLEGRVLGRYVVKTKPKATVAVLYQDDAYGRDLLAGLRGGLGPKAKQLVAVGYDPTGADVQSQVAQLRASKADTFMVFAFGKFAIQALVYASKLGWHPQVYVNAVASSATLMRIATLTAGARETKGAVSVVFFKDPTDPRWAKDPGIRLFRAVMKQFAPAANPNDGYYVAGMASAFTMVDALRKAGKDLTRDGIVKAVLSLNEVNNPFVVTGIPIKTSATDHFPMDSVGLQRWAGDHWVGFGGIVGS